MTDLNIPFFHPSKRWPLRSAEECPHTSRLFIFYAAVQIRMGWGSNLLHTRQKAAQDLSTFEVCARELPRYGGNFGRPIREPVSDMQRVPKNQATLSEFPSYFKKAWFFTYNLAFSLANFKCTLIFECMLLKNGHLRPHVSACPFPSIHFKTWRQLRQTCIWMQYQVCGEALSLGRTVPWIQ
jgi:hypothetical protein